MTQTNDVPIAPEKAVTQPEEDAPLASVEARYHDLLNRLGCTGHMGAVEEIRRLRLRAGLDD